ncbi:sulfurtransferase [Geodermatophilus sp. DSM 44513]|uniref:sulfurtransferase n=1 Tax=Geodermatophilus sp. DSM 44513 TaxID=1528104 RepID=UPI00127824F0|nr:sulfurtransferase [Geodermatophilus sp. DSM 44513]WNV77135.1 sulfurtransferase [Geodermatophilus sp. DSM 44513]
MLPPVVDTAWLRAHAGEVVLADVRWYLDGRSGRAAYDAGHLPGAVFVDLDRWLAGPPSAAEGRHPLPDPAVFAEGTAALGIGDEDTVVAYDDAGGVVAARLVWMLRVTGRPAALLDGGIGAWDGPLEQDAPDRAPAVATPRPWPADRLAGAEDVLDPRAVVLDAREPARYRGDREPVDPRAGHVPGAVNVPCRGNLDGDRRFLPADELRRRYTGAGVPEDGDVVVYCGSGVTACHDLLALEVAGLPAGRLYPGSWSQYSADPDRPVAVGDDPGAQRAGGGPGDGGRST